MKCEKVHVVNFLSMNSAPEFGMPAFFQIRVSAKLFKNISMTFPWVLLDILLIFQWFFHLRHFNLLYQTHDCQWPLRYLGALNTVESYIDIYTRNRFSEITLLFQNNNLSIVLIYCFVRNWMSRFLFSVQLGIRTRASYPISSDMILCVYRVNRFRVMVDHVRDPNKFQILWISLSCSAFGYVHTVPDRFLLRFKSCSGTVWTGINVLLWCRNCSEAFPVWTEALSVMQFATLSFDLKR